MAGHERIRVSMSYVRTVRTFFYFYAPKYQIKYYYGRSIQMKTFKYLTDVT